MQLRYAVTVILLWTAVYGSLYKMFACNKCSQSFPTISTYNKHQLLHRDDPDLVIKCLYPQCQSESSSYLSFRQHVLRNHSNFEEGHYCCRHDNCDFRVTKVTSLKRHYAAHLQNVQGLIVCGFCTGTKPTFETNNAYRVHISRHHSNIYDEVQSQQLNDYNSSSPLLEDTNYGTDCIAQDEASSSDNEMVIDANIQNDMENDTFPDLPGNPGSSNFDTPNDLQNNSPSEVFYCPCPHSSTGNTHDDAENDGSFEMPANPRSSTANTRNVVENNSASELLYQPHEETAEPQNDVVNPIHSAVEPPLLGATQIYSNLYLNMATDHFATEPLIQKVVSSTFSAFQVCEQNFTSAVKSSSLSANNQSSVQDMYREALEGVYGPHDPQNGIFRSTHTRTNYHRKNPNFVKPVDVPLRDQNGLPTGNHYTYVPILETLRVMLRDEDICRFCKNPEDSNHADGFFDISDGNVFKSNCFFRTNRKGWRIILFQDAFNVCDLLGSAKSKYKIVAVYMILGNLPPYARSKTNNIKLVLLCLEKDIKQFG